MVHEWFVSRPDPRMDGIGQAACFEARFGHPKPPQQHTGSPPLLAIQLASGSTNTATAKNLRAPAIA
ncbi:MAG: hypothetical protein ACRD2H_14000 [Terriglobales bacterium]